ncbi:late competence protein ComER [Bacillus sp. FJAT-27225]|uniref:late competence protein ComER n=1 Tax=Bacillus sp. FJAT-27225 TaxID=1743144 RepID=UPI00080C275C|nr:late competence protein ComER [Bacillus sp. FJAT-27225]OCA91176.1 late competence protein ComER [Bacillus sp. FJAT-27225]
MRIGIIGIGNMGRILAEAFIGSGVVKEESLIAFNRTKSKALALQKEFPGIRVCESAVEAACLSDIVFICVKPLDIANLLKEIASYLSKDKCLVSITSPISTNQLETLVGCSVIRAIPSITNRAFAGVSLLTFGTNCDNQWKSIVESIMQKISSPIKIEQPLVRVASDIVSCGPAFFSFILQQFISAAVKETGISSQMATDMASGMIVGMGELLRQGHYTLPTLQEKVCVKGGITGEGIKVLEGGELEELFRELFRTTNAKFNEDLEKTVKQYTPH